MIARRSFQVEQRLHLDVCEGSVRTSRDDTTITIQECSEDDRKKDTCRKGEKVSFPLLRCIYSLSLRFFCAVAACPWLKLPTAGQNSGRSRLRRCEIQSQCSRKLLSARTVFFKCMLLCCTCSLTSSNRISSTKAPGNFMIC